jgi:hypothetical protein
MTAELKLSRQWGSYAVRGKAWQVIVDGKTAGSIEHHQTIELPVDPGEHTLRVKASERYISQERRFQVADGEAVNFRCHGPLVLPMLLVSLVKPSLWITLKQD